MLNSVPASVQPMLLQALAAHADLSDAQKAALQALLATPKYAALSLPQQVAALNRPSTSASPARQNVPVKSMPINRFAAVLSGLLAAVTALPDSNAQKQPILDAYHVQQGVLALASTVDFSLPAIKSILDLCVQSGAVSQADVDAFATEPDPAWTPTTTSPPDFVGIAGAGKLAEADDVRQALSYIAGA